ncbi:adenylate/guanylate cyclase domain-containing protein [Reyranella sp.]|uniref:adenylate/guanylate cyclase domain-containing protein n=1 Tax=Reyranella sp. TaxID=1929291 RepID=UPI00403564FC
MTPAVPDFFADALRREIIRSEQQRMRALAIILAGLLGLALVVANVFSDYSSRIFERDVPGWLPLVGIAPFLIYELGSLTFLRYRAARDRDFPQVARFTNALIETSLPAVIIITLSHYMDPVLVFSYWPPLLYFVFILLSTLRLDFWLSVWTGTVASLQQMVLVMWLVPLQPWGEIPEAAPLFHFSRSLIFFACGLVAAYVATSLRTQFEKSVRAVVARDRVTNLFGQHVSPAVVDRLLATRSDPPSEIRTVCVLFLDIRGFTAMTRRRSAEETVALLNSFFAEMIEVIDRNNGIINKFLGDGFMALFGAPLEDPSAARNALAAARGMIETVERWNGTHPGWALRIGIGVHLGPAVTGTVGSPQRKEYTVIGDTVNLAARLEQLTKEVGAQLLISQSVRDATPCEGAVDLGPVAIRGYDEGVRVWRMA